MTTPRDPLVEALLALQAFEGLSDPPRINASYDVQLMKLRKPLPVSVLMHHQHRRQRKKLSITTASRTGVCGHCHIAVPRGLLQQMSRSGALASCPQCEGFLYMERENPGAAAMATKAAPKRARSKRPSASATP
jgi:hypothetical protein